MAPNSSFSHFLSFALVRFLSVSDIHLRMFFHEGREKCQLFLDASLSDTHTIRIAITQIDRITKISLLAPRRGQ